jgi:hypothetical protein
MLAIEWHCRCDQVDPQSVDKAQKNTTGHFLLSFSGVGEKGLGVATRMHSMVNFD